jgi:hypothetical protein
MPGWDNFFVAELGASAALTGLLFVAVSINLTRVLEFPQLPMRAVETLVSLVSVLVVSTFALVPGQSVATFGIEVAATGVFIWLTQTMVLSRTHREDRKYGNLFGRVLMNQAPPLPFIVAGILLIAGSSQGMYWIVPGTLMSFAAGIFGAWVLLIEIQR